MQCIQLNDSLRQYAGRGYWNDPDMLEVGNGMTENEDRAHFTMWCMMASPLILGNDLRSMSEATRNIIMNKEMIAIDQDTLGIQGLHYCDRGGLQFWLKPLAGGDWAFTILNPTKKDIACELNWQDFNLTDTQVSKLSTNFDAVVYKQDGPQADRQGPRRDCLSFNKIKCYGNEKMDNLDGLDGHCMHERTECA